MDVREMRLIRNFSFHLHALLSKVPLCINPINKQNTNSFTHHHPHLWFRLLLIQNKTIFTPTEQDI